MRVHVTVDEGEQTTQASIWVEDAAIDVDVDFIREARENLATNPFRHLLSSVWRARSLRNIVRPGISKRARASHTLNLHARPLNPIIDVSPGP